MWNPTISRRSALKLIAITGAQLANPAFGKIMPGIKIQETEDYLRSLFEKSPYKDYASELTYDENALRCGEQYRRIDRDSPLFEFYAHTVLSNQTDYKKLSAHHKREYIGNISDDKETLTSLETEVRHLCSRFIPRLQKGAGDYIPEGPFGTDSKSHVYVFHSIFANKSARIPFFNKDERKELDCTDKLLEYHLSVMGSKVKDHSEGIDLGWTKICNDNYLDLSHDHFYFLIHSRALIQGAEKLKDHKDEYFQAIYEMLQFQQYFRLREHTKFEELVYRHQNNDMAKTFMEFKKNYRTNS